MFTGRRFDIETGLYYYRARYYNPHIGRFMQTDPVGYDEGINWYAYCGNNPIGRADPSGLKPITDAEFGYLLKIRNSLSELAKAGRLSDVDALAGLAECVVVYTGSEPDDVSDFVDAFMRVGSAWLWEPSWSPSTWLWQDNPNYVPGIFADDGFKEEYQETRHRDPEKAAKRGYRDQTTHFIGFLGAGYHAPTIGIADVFLRYWEDGKMDSPDYKLGIVAIEVGGALSYYESDYVVPPGVWWFRWPCPLCGQLDCNGLAPNQVGNWIRNNLKEEDD